MNRRRMRVLLRSMLMLTATLAILLAGMRWVDWQQDQLYQETRDTGTEEFMQAGSVLWEGARYRPTAAVTTFLIAGIDRLDSETQGVSSSRYRSGGQADFLLLVAVDHTNRRIHQLQIDRDAMTDVTVLSVYGQETGTRVMQICLSHSYGANKEENAAYTLRAVRGLLNDIEIDGYYMIDYSAISALNDALGGVTVTVPDDMTSVEPAWEKGAVVTLQGSQAELFVRTRRTIGEGTNRERMRRQNEFMKNAVALLREKLADDPGFGSQLLSRLKRSATTNCPDQMLLEEIQSSAGYELLPVEYLDGEYAVGESGYMEFTPSEDSAEQWIMAHLYTKE